MKTIQFMAVGAAAGLLVGCASSEYTQTANTPNGAYMPQQTLTLEQLPQPCRTTIRNQIGDQPAAKIKEEDRNGQIQYRVELQKQNWHSHRSVLVVAVDGALIADSRMGTIDEAAGAELPDDRAHLGPIGDGGNPAAQPNPASPSPALAPSSVWSSH